MIVKSAGWYCLLLSGDRIRRGGCAIVLADAGLEIAYSIV
jgi:hypothetical protein